MKLAGVILISIGFFLVMFPNNWPDYITRLLRYDAVILVLDNIKHIKYTHWFCGSSEHTTRPRCIHSITRDIHCRVFVLSGSVIQIFMLFSFFFFIVNQIKFNNIPLIIFTAQYLSIAILYELCVDFQNIFVNNYS